MKGTITIMLAEDCLGRQLMGVEVDTEDVDKKGVFTILHHMMNALGLTSAEEKEFAIRTYFGKFRHETISDSHVEIDSEEHRAFKRMMEGLLE